MFRKAHRGRLGLVLLSLAFLLVSIPGLAFIGARAAEQPTGSAASPAQPGIVLKTGGGILGKEVHSLTDEKLGRIIDVIVDRTGEPRAALIDFGGFLGVGSRKIAIAWELLSFAGAPGSERIRVLTTRDRLSNAPEFREGKPIIVLTARDVNPARVTVRMPER